MTIISCFDFSSFCFSLLSYEEGKSSIIRQVNSLEYLGGQRSTDEALRAARQDVLGRAGERADVANLVILVTDGNPFPDTRRGPSIAEAAALQNQTTMISIGISNRIDRRLLELFSSEPRVENQDYFTLPNFATLIRIVQPLLTRIQWCPTTGKYLQGVRDGGG